MTSTVDLAVIGGGVVGLALADAWLARNPGDRVLVLDKEASVGEHASGRNSGVLHAGFYYAPDSLKAQLTRRGNQQLREFCHERGVPILENGKVVDRYQSLMNAGVRIPSYIEALTGISDAMIRSAPPVAEVMREVSDFVGDYPLVAHNASFDSRFWDAELVAENDGEPVDGVLTYRFVVSEPQGARRVSTPQSREVTAAAFVTNRKLDDISKIVVQGLRNSHVSSR